MTPAELSKTNRKHYDAIRLLSITCFAVIPSLYLGFVTVVALWLGVMQFFLLKLGQAPDPQFLVLGIAGASGLCGLWILVLVPLERLRSSTGLRIGATAASVTGTILALIFLVGGSVYGWSFSPRHNPRSAYLLGAPLLLALVKLFEVWRPYPPKPNFYRAD